MEALDDCLRFSFKEGLVSAFDLGVLHLSLQLVTQDAIELINILLLILFIVVPAKSLEKFMGSNIWSLTELQIPKDTLHTEWNTVAVALRQLD